MVTTIEIGVMAILALSFVAWIAWQIKKQGLKGFVTELIVRAEKEFNQGENAEKFDFVVEKLIAAIPMPFSMFITTKMVRKFVQETFTMIKSALDYRPEEKEENIEG